MKEKQFIEYFWYRKGMIITNLKHKILVFDEFLFYREAIKYLNNHFSSKEKSRSYYCDFEIYLTQDIALSRLLEKVNFVMKFMYEIIENGSETLNEYTEYNYQNNEYTEDNEDILYKLQTILSAFHSTSLKNNTYGKFDTSIKPVAYDETNFIIRLMYFERNNFMSKILKKVPPVWHEIIIELNKIERIYGNSNSLYISFFNKKPILEITPTSSKWIN